MYCRLHEKDAKTMTRDDEAVVGMEGSFDRNRDS